MYSYRYRVGYSPRPGVPLTRKIILRFCLRSGEVGTLGKYLRERNYSTAPQEEAYVIAYSLLFIALLLA